MLDDTFLAGLYSALSKAWSAQTAYKGDWSPQTPTRNQCAVTALVVQTHLGGVLVRARYTTPTGESGTHYWNRVGEEEVDFTREQFPIGSTLEVLSNAVEPQTLLTNADTAARFALLKARAQTLLSQ